MGFDYVMEYVENNSVLQGDRCKWLKDESDRTTTCLAYDRSSSECRDYPDYTISSYYRIGKGKIELS